MQSFHKWWDIFWRVSKQGSMHFPIMFFPPLLSKLKRYPYLCLGTCRRYSHQTYDPKWLAFRCRIEIVNVHNALNKQTNKQTQWKKHKPDYCTYFIAYINVWRYNSISILWIRKLYDFYQHTNNKFGFIRIWSRLFVIQIKHIVRIQFQSFNVRTIAIFAVALIKLLIREMEDVWMHTILCLQCENIFHWIYGLSRAFLNESLEERCCHFLFLANLHINIFKDENIK